MIGWLSRISGRGLSALDPNWTGLKSHNQSAVSEVGIIQLVVNFLWVFTQQHIRFWRVIDCWTATAVRRVAHNKITRAAFRVPPPRHRGEIWSASLLWTKFSLKNGGLHFQLKEQLQLAEKVFQNGGLHKGLPFTIKRTILIGCTSYVRGAFCLPSLHWSWRCLRCFWGRPWTQIGGKKAAWKHIWVNSEAYPEHSPGPPTL